ncbi:MAG: hypothetical protein ABIP34_01415 [Rhodoferax sp.]|uniref:hypothetical protein n=1 Tax=Rhodoferax sp. TaxID=50421 RepID=UPI0032679173
MKDRIHGHGRSPAFRATALLAICVLVLAGVQLLNLRKVYQTLCTVKGLACTFASIPTVFEAGGTPAPMPKSLLAHPLHVQVDTALVRRACDGHWSLGFGARLELDPVTLGPQFTSGAICADVFRQRVHVSVAGGSLRYGDCTAGLDGVAVDWDDALVAKLTGRVAADATAGCAALLPQSLGAVKARQITAQRVDLELRYAIPYAQREILTSLADAHDTPTIGWVRRGLAAMDTVHDLRVALPDGSVSVRLATTPGANAANSSPELTLAVSAQGRVLTLLPEGLKSLGAPSTPLTVRWHLDHETGVVLVNNKRIERRVPAPRAPGRTFLGAAECGKNSTAPTPSMYFVEAGEDGGSVNPAQVSALFDGVEEAVAGPGVLVSVFVHGWQHSAAPGDSYVCDYGQLMNGIEAMERQAAKASGRVARKVVGVYVGWQGNLFPDEIANGTTFWNRLEAADRLGSKDALLRQVIDGLAQRMAKGAPDTHADRRSALVVTGHSLGGRAVFHAVRDGIAPAAGTTPGTARPDLVLLVNPAFSAELYRDIYEKERQCKPLGMALLSFSSEADNVTRQVYPAGEAITFDAAAQHAASFAEHVYTAANFGEFVTHRLRMDVLQGEPPHPTDAQTIERGFKRVPSGSGELYVDNPVTVFRQPGSGFPRIQDAWYRMRLDSVATAPSRCPDKVARVIEVDARILPDHGKIFTPPFMEYVVRTLNRSIVGAGAQ